MDSVIWPIEAHTQAKHDILRGYLEAWFPIVSTHSKRIIYLDAFAGPGVYTGGEPGSPLIALKTLITHRSFPKMRETEFLFAFIEKDKSKCQRLEQEIANFLLNQGNGKLSNIVIWPKNDEFGNVVQDVLNELGSKDARLAPTFAFVDPFGWSNIRLDLMMQFVSFRKCEVLVTFMVESISRFLSVPDKQKIWLGYFGTDRYRECISLSGNDKIECLKDLYINQLRESGSFEYITSFKMINKRGKVYFLIHCTRHIKGLQEMKNVMWNVDMTGNYKFEARWMGRQGFFDPSITQDLKKELVKEFRGREVSISEIENYVLTDTIYIKKHIRPTLREMEDEGIISVSGRTAHSSEQAILEGMEDQKRKTYPHGTKIDFSE